MRATKRHRYDAEEDNETTSIKIRKGTAAILKELKGNKKESWDAFFWRMYAKT